MPDLADFLLARIAEDEDRARTFLADNHAALVRADLPFRDSAMSFVVRVLAECEAKRRIVGDAFDMSALDLELDADAPVPHHTVLRLLALPYADHPDYDEVWRP